MVFSKRAQLNLHKLRTSVKPWSHLFLNHMDAWGATLGITLSAALLHDVFTPYSLYLIFAITAGYWLAFAINDYFDAPYDAADPKKAAENFFVQNQISLRTGLIAFFIISIPLGPAFLLRGWRGIIVVAICLFIMWSYSMPPLRFKTRPGIDLIVHIVFVETFPYATMLFMLGVAWTKLDYVILTIAAGASFMAQLEQQIRDAPIDALHEQTFTTQIGAKKAIILLQCGAVFTIVFGFYHLLIGTIPWFVAPLGLFAVPAVLHRFLRRPGDPRPEKLIRLTVLISFAYIAYMFVSTLTAGT